MIRAWWALLTIPLLTHAQSGQETPVFRSTTRLVQVNVIVRDGKGMPVTDLKKEEFIVTEQGKPQQISFLTIQNAEKLAVPPAKLGKNMFSNMLEQQNGVPSSVSVILLDLLNTPWADLYRAREGIIKYLQQLKPGDRIALYTLSRGLRVLHDYTTDASSLLNRLNNYKGEVMTELGSSQVDPVEVKIMQDLGMEKLLLVRQREADFYTNDRVVNTLKSLEVIAHHLASLPGRKNLVWVSAGFPLNLGFDEIPEVEKVTEKRSFWTEAEAAIRALNDAGVSVYPVDARGLMVNSQIDSSFEGRNLTASPHVMPSRIVPNLDSMMQLANRTGGRVAYNRNDIDGSIRQAIEDARITYNLGYYSTYENQDGRFRDISIKVKRPGLDVRHRKGYFAFRPIQDDEKTRQEQLKTAFWAPIDATAVRVNARVDLIDKPEPNTVHVFVQVDPQSIMLNQQGDRRNGKIDLLIAQKDDRGKLLGKNMIDRVNLALTQKTYAEISKQGLIYQSHFTKEAGAHSLRIIVRDVSTGAIGTLTVPFSQVPFMSVPDAVGAAKP
jgi:VWFA-related protein